MSNLHTTTCPPFKFKQLCIYQEKVLKVKELHIQSLSLPALLALCACVARLGRQRHQVWCHCIAWWHAWRYSPQPRPEFLAGWRVCSYTLVVLLFIYTCCRFPGTGYQKELGGFCLKPLEIAAWVGTAAVVGFRGFRTFLEVLLKLGHGVGLGQYWTHGPTKNPQQYATATQHMINTCKRSKGNITQSTETRFVLLSCYHSHSTNTNVITNTVEDKHINAHQKTWNSSVPQYVALFVYRLRIVFVCFCLELSARLASWLLEAVKAMLRSLISTVQRLHCIGLACKSHWAVAEAVR